MNNKFYYNTQSQGSTFSIRRLAGSASRISTRVLKTTNMTRAQSFAKNPHF